MRLLVVTQYFWPENFRINDLVSDMVRRGHSVTVLTGKPNYPDGHVFEDFLARPAAFDAYEGARIVRVPMLARGRGSLRLALNYLTYALSASGVGAWRLRGQPFDAILVCQLSPVTVALPGVWMRLLKRAPMALWVLDLWPETLQAVGIVRSDWLLRQVGYLVGWIYRRSDLIAAQSRSFIPKILQRAGRPVRVEYFPSWAEALFDGPPAAPAPEVELASEKFTVLFAGNIGEAQDFPAILSAAERLKHNHRVRWLILGDGRQAAWVAQEVASRGLSHCVQLLGRYPLDRMPAFFRHADALLVSLKDEAIFAMTIPGKLQSYLASGVPVVAMLNGEGANLLTGAGAGLASAAGDSAGLAAAVAKLCDMSPAERAALGRAGVELYRREFERTSLLGKMEAWLQHLQFRKP